MYTVHSVHGRGADLPFFLRFGHIPILVQINLQHSHAQPYGVRTRVIYLTQTHCCKQKQKKIIENPTCNISILHITKIPSLQT